MEMLYYVVSSHPCEDFLMALLIALAKHSIARKLHTCFNPAKLNSDLGSIPESWWGRHLGPYHDGAWESVSLWAPGGDLREQRSFGQPYASTEALVQCQYFRTVMDTFPCEKSRVRLMRLRAGGHIFLHSDPIEMISKDLLRVHVPITTNPDVHFRVNGQRVQMQCGEVWHIDVRFPHEVHNLGERHRVHLVLDLLRNARIDALLHDATSIGSGSLTRYYLKQAVRHSIKRVMRGAN